MKRNPLWRQLIDQAKCESLKDMWKGQELRVYRAYSGRGDDGHYVVQCQTPDGSLIGYSVETGRPEIFCKHSPWYIPSDHCAVKAFEASHAYYRSDQYKYIDRWKDYKGESVY